MKIGNINIKKGVVLAPMAGFSDVGLRALACEFGADYAVTEMVSAKGLLHAGEKTLNLLKTSKNEKIKVIQLFGSDPAVFAQVVRLPCLEKFDIIDINMGCPVKKIVKNGEGSALMKNAELAGKIVKACVENTSKPITVKFRKGFNSETAADFAKECERAGASAIAVHARTALQGYSGKADWSVIKKVKDAVKIPVFANGDITDATTYKKVLQETTADGVLIGRAALGAPWIFSEILGKKFDCNVKKVVLRHIKILEEHKNFKINDFKPHLIHYAKGRSGAKEFREKIFAAKTKKQLLLLVEEYF